MEWLTPLTALYAAAITVPLLLLLYFLKLKRREQIISSTLLWKRAVHDLQVNAPFQRLRRNILLLLQLLMLLVILLALAWPILSLVAGPGQRYVLLIDRSASMNAISDSSQNSSRTSRLDTAKEQAKVFIDSLRSQALFSLRDKSDQMMVMAFDNHAKVMCNFTSDKRQLISAVDAIEPGHATSSLAEAVVVANAFAQSPGVDADFASAEEPAKLILFSDGQIRDLDQLVIGSGELTFHCIGDSNQNIAITAMQARRSYEDPEQIEIFATVANFGNNPVTCDVQLSLNNDVRSVRSVTVPEATPDNDSKIPIAGKVAVNFSLSETQAGVLEVRQMQRDCLPCDDAAWAVISAPERLSVLLVTRGNIVLESALKACPLARFEVLSPEQFDALNYEAMSIEQPYDVIVLDQHVPAHLPKCRYLVYGRPPNNIDISVTGQLENQFIVDWRPKHPVLKYVNLMNLFAAKSFQMNLPRDAEVLAEFNETPALALIRRNGSVFLLAGFDILESNWPFEPSFVLFCYNATSFLGMQVGQNQQSNLQVGDPIIVEGLNPQISARISGPELPETEVETSSAGVIRYANTSRVGVYSVNVPEQPVRLFAVNLLDAQESNIQPVREIVLPGQRITAEEKAVSRANLPLWPYLVCLALILALLEWLIYTFKVRI
jgi:hypothetical protein